MNEILIDFLLFVEYLTSSPTTNNSNQPADPDDPSSNDKYLQSLEKQLTIEMKVKNGTENMIQSISQNYQSRDKKLLAEAYTMLDDSKAKIEFLKLKILKVKQNHQLNRVSLFRFFRRQRYFNEWMFSSLGLGWERRVEIERTAGDVVRGADRGAASSFTYRGGGGRRRQERDQDTAKQ